LIVKCGDKGMYDSAATPPINRRARPGVFIAMQIRPGPADHEAWLLASTSIHAQRPIVHLQPDGGLIVLKWYQAHVPRGRVVNVTGAGDSLVGSLLASVVHGGEDGNPFHHPSRLDSAIGRAQDAAVCSLQSPFAVARDPPS
jgi:pseudouridine-5'-phosphate glycosidase/pseudouridine kinase